MEAGTGALALPLARLRRPIMAVERVFTGRGNGVAAILRSTGTITSSDLQRWMADNRVDRRVRASQLRAEQWASLWAVVVRRIR